MIYVYRWEALTRAGRRREGLRRAPSPEAVVQALQAEALRALALRIDWPATVRGWLQRGPRRGELAASLAYLASYLEFTTDLRRAVASARRTSVRPALQALWAAVEEGLQRGLGVSEALRSAPGMPPAVPTAVAAAERAGRLREGLGDIARHLGEEAELVRTLRRALSYPAILLGLGGTITLGVIGVVLPRIAETLRGVAELPWVTRLLLAALAHAGWMVGLGGLAAVGGAVGLGLWARRHPAAFRRALWRLPLAGAVLRQAALARLLGNLALQLGQGVPLLAAVDAERRHLPDPALGDLLGRVREGLLLGRGPAEVLGPPDFPEVVQEAATQGEETGQLPRYLGAAAALLRRQALEQAARLGQVLEPVLLLAIGAVVLLIALALLLPIYGTLQRLSPYQ